MHKPSDAQIRELARREARLGSYREFAPIERGPLFALLGLAFVGIVSLPWLAMELFRSRPPRSER